LATRFLTVTLPGGDAVETDAVTKRRHKHRWRVRETVICCTAPWFATPSSRLSAGAAAMAWIQDFPGATVVEERAERALRFPVGAVSPLWAVFGAAASVGVAYWWLSQWTKSVNIEAMTGAFAPSARPKLTLVEPVAAAEPPAEAAPNPVVTAALEAVSEPVEAIVEAALVEAPTADDLTRMTGIGPKLSVALAERGVTRFAQIAAWTADELAEIDAALSLKGRAAREAWVAQAKRLAKGD
jgi:predicted flap endonuclease-1-like 5' DNA nuclease